MKTELDQSMTEASTHLGPSPKAGSPRKGAQVIERVTLSEEAVKRLEHWSSQVRGARHGVDISRRDLVNWLILSHSEALSSNEERELSEKYYDEVRFIQYALKELRAAKLRGESVTLKTLMGGAASLQEIAGQLAPRKRKQGKRGIQLSDGAALAVEVDAVTSPVIDTAEVDTRTSEKQ